MAKNKFWKFENIIGNKSADLYIYNEISSWDDEDVTSAQSFKEELDSIGDVSTINLYINSPGGSVADGLAIASMLKRSKAEVIAQVDGLACSIASVIACSADRVIMRRNCMMMIHNALSGGFFYDNAKGFRKLADDLDKVSESLRTTYIDKAKGKLDEEKLIELMDNETWLTANECLELGLCDEIIDSNKMVASISNKYASFFNNIPTDVEISNEEDENDDDILQETQDAVKEDIEELEVEDEDDNVINELKSENEELKNKLNSANETIITLNEKVSELQVLADQYNEILEERKSQEDKVLLEEKKNYFKEKFDKVGAMDKYNSEEVQSLLSNCIKDKDSLLKLTEMIVDMVDSNERGTGKRIETVSKLENLISIDDIKEKYGFK